MNWPPERTMQTLVFLTHDPHLVLLDDGELWAVLDGVGWEVPLSESDELVERGWYWGDKWQRGPGKGHKLRMGARVNA